MSLDGTAEKAIEFEADRIIVINRWRGGLGKINLFQISSKGLKPFPPLLPISDIHFRREFKKNTRGAKSTAITLDPKGSAKLIRISERISKYFGLPVLSLDEAREDHGASMHFSFSSSQDIQITFMLLSRMVEIGPRVTISKLIWEVPS